MWNIFNLENAVAHKITCNEYVAGQMIVHKSSMQIFYYNNNITFIFNIHENDVIHQHIHCQTFNEDTSITFTLPRQRIIIIICEWVEKKKFWNDVYTRFK